MPRSRLLLASKSLKAHGEFTALYEETVQNVAMSEGLGQKYGAPCRRAQERIRTEVQRDEQAAGKIDEMLANLEFICNEVKRTSEDPESETLAGSVAPQKDDWLITVAQMEKMKEVWACYVVCALLPRPESGLPADRGAGHGDTRSRVAAGAHQESRLSTRRRHRRRTGRWRRGGGSREHGT